MIPAGVLVTVPLPVPLRLTLRVKLEVPPQFPPMDPVPSNLKTAVAAQPGTIVNVVGVPLPSVSGAIGVEPE